MSSYTEELLNFIQDHPSVYHVIDGHRRKLAEAGYVQLKEHEKWQLEEGGKYFVVRDDAAIIAFRIPRHTFHGFMVMASHGDSPALKVKESPEISTDGKYRRLNVELYGGALLSQWLDRPLSVAGRIMVLSENRVKSMLVNISRDLVLIPSLAIHMDRTVNEGHAIKIQKDMLPVYGLVHDPGLMELIANDAGISTEAIIGSDLFLYNRQPPSIWGAAYEFMSSPRLDDQQCAFASLCGFMESEDTNSACIPVHAIFDHEEIGSITRQGAASPFLKDVLERIMDGLGMSHTDYLQKLSQSFMLSADNAHAFHPNYPEKCDPVVRPVLGGGVVLKQSGSQKYTTDAVSAAIVRMLAREAEIRLQVFVNHSDIPGGSTLGHISSQQLAIRSADVGIAQLAMHSPYETSATGDTEDLVKLAKILFSSIVFEHEDGAIELMASAGNQNLPPT